MEKKRIQGVGLLGRGMVTCLIWVLLGPWVSAGEGKKIELILDASGSMRGKLSGGEVKLAAAKKAVNQLVQELDENTVIAFRAYGHQSDREKHDCQDTQLLVPFGELGNQRQQIEKHTQDLVARGYTPITWVLGKAADDFSADFEGDRVIILVSDGKETCEGDPCATAQKLAAAEVRTVVHTVGLGVDDATRGQLECIARVTGGGYFGAESALELAQVLSDAVATASLEPVEEEGQGWLEVKGADISGHTVRSAETGEEVAMISAVNAIAELPAAIYNVTIGSAVWKSIEVKTGETTVLEPGLLNVKPASIRGHMVAERETGEEHGMVSSLHQTIALMPGDYDVFFGEMSWPVRIEGGQTVTLKPGTVQVKGAYIGGHAIHAADGRAVCSVSATLNWAPLPPGQYTIEVDGQTRPFTLAEGEAVEFTR